MSATNAERACRWFEEVWNCRRPEAIETFLTPESVGHLATGSVVGIDAFKHGVHAAFLAAFPDLKITVEDTISEGDKVAVRWWAEATHSGDGLGLPPTNRRVGFRGITWIEFRDGKFCQGYDSWNLDGLLKQLAEPA